VVRLWDLPTGKELGRFVGHQGLVKAVAFSPDARRLASASEDGTALVWDMAALVRDGPRKTAELPADELDNAWAELAQVDATRAYRALGALVGAPRQAIAFLGAKVRPVAAPDGRRLARLIARLGDDDFAARDQASEDLAELGPLAEPALRQALKGRPSPEVGQRVRALLQKLETPAVSRQELRALRAVEVLEYVGTGEARKVLATLAQGVPQARLTREAKVSLERLAKRGDGGARP
jgi:hypothetical protein